MKTIDGKILKNMIISASNNLYNHYPEIDQLNVFPIPDGDTGTNMNLTISSGAAKVYEVKEEKNIYLIAEAFKKGLLFGARGNSGVILSQIFRGFADSLKDKTEANAFDIADAFVNAKTVAYQNVMTPVEGTILTVVREASETLSEQVKEHMHIYDVFDIFLKEAKASLQRTPDLLPVLREAGVVDSGGAGFVKIIEGMSKALHNQVVEKIMPQVVSTNFRNDEYEFKNAETANVQSKFKHEEFGYCTEFILRLPKEEDLMKLGKRPYNKKRIDAVLNAHGNSIVSVHDDDLVKVHIHTMRPGHILTYAQQFGEFVKLKIENMSEQHSHLIEENQGEVNSTLEVKNIAKTEQNKQRSEFALIAVANGEGIKKEFTNLGVTRVVSGGQTMNPSTEDFVNACREVNADVVYIFPNNSNIIMAASQASDVLQGECRVNVIPTKSIPAGIAACMIFNPSSSENENVESMNELISEIKTGEITFSVRDTEIDGTKVHNGDFMAISKKKIVCSVKTKEEALEKLLKKLIDSDSSIVTIYYGLDVNEKTLEFVEKLKNKYTKNNEDLEFEIKNGGQPVYSFYVSVE